MTISTSRTNNPDITTIIRDAFMGCGILNEHQELSPAQATRGRAILEKLVDFPPLDGQPTIVSVVRHGAADRSGHTAWSDSDLM